MNELDQGTDAVVVVGGGITGMTTALALDHRGIRVRLLERGRREVRTGAGISIDRGVLERATGHCADDLPVEHDRFYDLAAWDDIHGWLASRIQRSGVAVEHQCVVTSVVEDHADVAVSLSDGSARSAELLVGADGVRSVVRGHIAPHQPLAEYTGYTAWRGLVAERDLPPGTPRPREGHSLELLQAGDFTLFAYVVPGPDGSTVPGGRRLAFIWSDPRRHAELADGLGLEDRSFRTVSAADVPRRLLEELVELARSTWPDPWNAAILHAIRTRALIATPVADYLPAQLSAGRVGLVGDAAHAVTPMAGAGLYNGLLDALALALAVERHGTTSTALEAYDSERLEPSRRLVQAGRQATRAYLASVGARRRR